MKSRANTPKEKQDEIFDFYEKNRQLSVNDVAMHFNLPRATVQKMVRRYKERKKLATKPTTQPKPKPKPKIAPATPTPNPVVADNINDEQTYEEVIDASKKIAALHTKAFNIPYISKSKWTNLHGFQIETDVALQRCA